MILENITAVPSLRWKMDSGSGVKIQFIVHEDSPIVRAGKSGKAVKRERLSGAARAEQDSYSSLGVQMNVEFKGFRFRTGGKTLN